MANLNGSEAAHKIREEKMAEKNGTDLEWEGDRSGEWEEQGEFLFGMRRQVRKNTESIFMTEEEAQAHLYVLRRASEGMVYGNDEEE
jgi:hypothetical protein